MFDRRIGDDLAVVQEIVHEAVARANVPGASSGGNAAGVYSAVASGLVAARLSSGQSVRAHFGESGVDSSGNEFYPFLLDVDGMDVEGPYLV